MMSGCRRENPIWRKTRVIPHDLDITNDRMVNGVTQDPELSSEATTCVVRRDDR